jgi:hypothetical protein
MIETSPKQPDCRVKERLGERLRPPHDTTVKRSRGSCFTPWVRPGDFPLGFDFRLAPFIALDTAARFRHKYATKTLMPLNGSSFATGNPLPPHRHGNRAERDEGSIGAQESEARMYLF